MSALLDSRLKSAIALLWIALVVLGITFGTNYALNRATTLSLRQDAAYQAFAWADALTQAFPEVETIAETGRMSETFLERFRRTLDHSDVLQFKIYNTDGLLRYILNEDQFIASGGGVNSATAKIVARNGERISKIGQRNPGEPEAAWPALYAAAFVPTRNSDGDIYGVIEIIVDLTPIAEIFRDNFNWLAVTMPIAASLLYLLPALAWLGVNRQKADRDRKVQELSRLDALTGLLNRGTFGQEAGELFEARSGPIGVLFLDADHFKAINDTYGHEFGDAYLGHIAAALAGSVRVTDLVARLGGDEFVAVLPHTTAEDLVAVARRTIDRVCQPFEYKGDSVTGQVSIGTHLSTAPETLEAAINCADVALYHAKDSGRGILVAYDERLDLDRQRRRLIEAALGDMFEEDRAYMVYQPIVRASDDRVVGFETLMRLRTRDGEDISPEEFIPIAEKTGLIHELGSEALKSAFQTAMTWPDDVFISVNLSPAQFRRSDLAQRILWLLDQSGLPARRLELEITENLLLGHEPRIADQLATLTEAGISLAIDDFGKGYSSLKYLLDYRFDKLKIDQVFIDTYPGDTERQRDILRTIILLGHQLGMTVTVEGVERREQLDMLRQMECDLFQGYLFGRPMTARETASRLADRKPPRPNSRTGT
jgi:diguanylate cyclase (GGDEF)-like protein